MTPPPSPPPTESSGNPVVPEWAQKALAQMMASAGNMGAQSPVTPDSWRGLTGTGYVPKLIYLPKKEIAAFPSAEKSSPQATTAETKPDTPETILGEAQRRLDPDS